MRIRACVETRDESFGETKKRIARVVTNDESPQKEKRREQTKKSISSRTKEYRAVFRSFQFGLSEEKFDSYLTKRNSSGLVIRVSRSRSRVSLPTREVFVRDKFVKSSRYRQERDGACAFASSDHERPQIKPTRRTIRSRTTR